MHSLLGKANQEMVGIGSPRTSSNYLLQWILAVYILSAVLISFLPSGANISQGIGALLAFAFVASLLIEKRRVLLQPELYILGLFVVYTLVGGFLARNLAAFWIMEATLFQLFLLTIIIYNIGQSKTAGLVIAKTFVLATTIASVLAVLRADSGRIAGVFLNPNKYGAILLFAIFFASYLLVTRAKKRQQVLLIAVISWLSWNVLLSGSRTAILGLLVFLGFSFLLYACRKVTKRPLRVIMVAVVLAALLIGGLFSLEPDLARRLENVWLVAKGADLQEGDLAIRYGFFQAALYIWQDHPLLGVGSNQFRYYAVEYNPDVLASYAHSDYAEILANYGLTGFLLYYAFSFSLLMRALRLRVSMIATKHALPLDILTASLFSFFASEVGFVLYYNKVAWIGLTLILCLLQALGRERHEVTSHGI